VSSHKLNQQELQLLLDFFPTQISEQQKLTFSRVKGYLTSLSLSPVTITPEKWWEAIKTLPEINFESKEQEVNLCKVMIKIDDSIKTAIKEGINPVPDYEDLAAVAYGSSAVEQWCRGFMDGVLVCEDIWFSVKDKKMTEDLELAFGVVALIADREQIKMEMRSEDYDQRIDDAQRFLPQVILKLDEIRGSYLYDHFKIKMMPEDTSVH
jgi:uncharacterized protein